MKAKILLILLAISLASGSLYPAMAQTSSMADHVVINEIEINPPGDDSFTISEWVELYNPTDSPVDLSGWEIASTTILKKTLTLSEGTIIQPGKFLTFQNTKVWFTDVSERVELRDASGTVIDETPVITDVKNDFTSWQRVYDALDTDSSNDWKYVISTAGLTNGQLETTQEETSVVVTLELDKEQYLFGESATIRGSVSEEVFVEQPFFEPEKIILTIDGPNYFKEITMFPDFFLNYETTLNLQKVLGINEGVYDVTASYAGSTSNSQFTVGDEVLLIQEKEASVLSIFSDFDSYIPGQTAKIMAKTSEVLPLEGLKFKIVNPDKIQIYEGTLFPNLGGGATSAKGGSLDVPSDVQFFTTVYMDTINPVYGIHEITAEYGPQRAVGSFELLEDIKEDKPISLNTDKEVYGLGETVLINGRTNKVWVPALDLAVEQIEVRSLDLDPNKILKDEWVVNLAGDSTFYYEFEIGTDKARYGEYRVKVSKDIGSEEIFFKVVENPETYVAESDEPLVLSLDKPIYNEGDKFVLSGKVNDLLPSKSILYKYC